jgi:hypothetical protein
MPSRAYNRPSRTFSSACLDDSVLRPLPAAVSSPVINECVQCSSCFSNDQTVLTAVAINEVPVVIVKEKPAGRRRPEGEEDSGLARGVWTSPGLLQFVARLRLEAGISPPIVREAGILPTPQIFPSFVDDGVYPPPSTKSQE